MLRVDAVLAHGIHHGNGRDGPRCRVVVIRHEDFDSAAACQLDLLAAARAAVCGHDQRPSFDGRPFDGPKRQPVPVSDPLGNIWRNVQAEPAECQHEDRQAGQTVSVKVAVDEDPLAPGPGLGNTTESRIRVGQQPRVVQAAFGGRQEAKQVIGCGHASRRQQPQEALGNPSLDGQGAARGIDDGRLCKPPAEAWNDHAVQDDMERSTAAYRRINSLGGVPPLSERTARHARFHARLGSMAPPVRQAFRPVLIAASRFARRRSSQSCQTTSSGLALKIEEYVPEMMPMSSARTK